MKLRSSSITIGNSIWELTTSWFCLLLWPYSQKVNTKSPLWLFYQGIQYFLGQKMPYLEEMFDYEVNLHASIAGDYIFKFVPSSWGNHQKYPVPLLFYRFSYSRNPRHNVPHHIINQHDSKILGVTYFSILWSPLLISNLYRPLFFRNQFQLELVSRCSNTIMVTILAHAACIMGKVYFMT